MEKKTTKSITKGKKQVTVDRPDAAASFVMSTPSAPKMNALQYLNAFNNYVNAAVVSIAHEVASIDLHLYQKRSINGQVQIKEIVEHPALSLLHYVNAMSTGYDLLEGTQIYLELLGEAFWVVLFDEVFHTPAEIWLLRPDWIKIIPSKENVIDHYEYLPGGLPKDKFDIPVNRMVPFKYFNPVNPYRGRGSTEAGAYAIDTFNFATEWNRDFFFNGATPGMVMSTDQKVDQAVLDRFKEAWQATYGGRKNSNKVAFLSGGFKPMPTSSTAKDMDFANQLKTMRDDILAVYRVPKTVIGITEDVNKANAEATTEAYMQRTITPKMKKLTGMLNEFFLPMFGDDSLFFDFTNPVPEDQQYKATYYETVLKAGYMTPNEVRKVEGLPPIEGGDTLLPLLAPAGKGFFSGLFKGSTKEEKETYRKPKLMMPIPPKHLKQYGMEKIEKTISEDVYKLVKTLVGKDAKKLVESDKKVPQDGEPTEKTAQPIEADKKDLMVADIVREAVGKSKERLEAKGEDLMTELTQEIGTKVTEMVKDTTLEEAEKKKVNFMQKILSAVLSKL